LLSLSGHSLPDATASALVEAAILLWAKLMRSAQSGACLLPTKVRQRAV